MASKFNLVAQLHLRAPTNTQQVIGQMKSQLQGLTANINLQVNNQSVAQVAQLNKQIQSAGKSAKVAKDSLVDFGKQSALAIKRFAAFTFVTAGFFQFSGALRKAVGDAVDFQKSMVQLGQVTGQTLAGLKPLSDEIARLSTTFGVSSSELIRISRVLAQTGMTADDTRIALEALAKTTLAPTFESIDNTVEGSIAIMSQFGVKATQLNSVLGSINSVAAQFAVESEDITTAVRRTGGAFAAAGGNLQEFIALFTSVRSTTRESAESIATGFRTIFTRLQRSSTIDFLSNLGIQLRDVNQQFIGPYKAVEKLSEALSTIPSTDPRYSQIIEELGGFRQVSKVIPLIQQYAVAQRALGVAMSGQDSLARDAATAQEALAVRIQKVKEEFSALIRKFSENKTLQKFVDMTLSLASALIKVADSLEPLMPLLIGLGAVGAAKFFRKTGPSFLKTLGFAKGGVVPGYGTGDVIPARLTPGEFVMSKEATSNIGVSNLQRMNRGDKVQKFPTGSFDPIKPIEPAKIQKVSGPAIDIALARRIIEYASKNDVPFQKIDTIGLGTQERNRITVGIASDIDKIRPDIRTKLTRKEATRIEPSAGDIKVFGVGMEPYVKGSHYYTHDRFKIGEDTFHVTKVGIDPKFDRDLSGELGTTINEVVVNYGHSIAKMIGAQFDDKSLEGFLASKTKLSGAYGQIFEGILASIGAPYVEVGNAGKSIDFPTGLGSAEALFGLKSGATRNSLVDAKKNLEEDSLKDLAIAASTFVSSLPEIEKESKIKINPARYAKGDIVPALVMPGEYIFGPQETKRIGTPKLRSINKMATGGVVPGVGNTDSVPMNLQAGSFVIRKKAVENVGVENLQRLAVGGKVQKLAPKYAASLLSRRDDEGGSGNIRRARRRRLDEEGNLLPQAAYLAKYRTVRHARRMWGADPVEYPMFEALEGEFRGSFKDSKWYKDMKRKEATKNQKLMKRGSKLNMGNMRTGQKFLDKIGLGEIRLPRVINQLSLEEPSDETRFGGTFKPSTRTISIYNKDQTQRIFLHELGHSLEDFVDPEQVKTLGSKGFSTLKKSTQNKYAKYYEGYDADFEELKTSEGFARMFEIFSTSKANKKFSSREQKLFKKLQPELQQMESIIPSVVSSIKEVYDFDDPVNFLGNDQVQHLNERIKRIGEKSSSSLKITNLTRRKFDLFGKKFAEGDIVQSLKRKYQKSDEPKSIPSVDEMRKIYLRTGRWPSLEEVIGPVEIAKMFNYSVVPGGTLASEYKRDEMLLQFGRVADKRTLFERGESRGFRRGIGSAEHVGNIAKIKKLDRARPEIPGTAGTPERVEGMAVYIEEQLKSKKPKSIFGKRRRKKFADAGEVLDSSYAKYIDKNRVDIPQVSRLQMLAAKGRAGSTTVKALSNNNILSEKISSILPINQLSYLGSGASALVLEDTKSGEVYRIEVGNQYIDRPKMKRNVRLTQPLKTWRFVSPSREKGGKGLHKVTIEKLPYEEMAEGLMKQGRLHKDPDEIEKLAMKQSSLVSAAGFTVQDEHSGNIGIYRSKKGKLRTRFVDPGSVVADKVIEGYHKKFMSDVTNRQEVINIAKDKKEYSTSKLIKMLTTDEALGGYSSKLSKYRLALRKRLGWQLVAKPHKFAGGGAVKFSDRLKKIVESSPMRGAPLIEEILSGENKKSISLRKKLSKVLPENIEYLGSGAYGIAFKDPDTSDVYRVEAANIVRPKVPQMLQPTSVKQFKDKRSGSRVTVEKLPYVKPIGAIQSYDEAVKMGFTGGKEEFFSKLDVAMQEVRDLGLNVQDYHLANIALTPEGKPVAIDPGVMEFWPPGEERMKNFRKKNPKRINKLAKKMSESDIRQRLKDTHKKTYSDMSLEERVKVTDERDLLSLVLRKKLGLSPTLGYKRSLHESFGPIVQYNQGGSVDSVPALLSAGEFVISKDAVNRIGVDNLNRMNRGGKIQKFAGGGIVRKFDDGGNVKKGGIAGKGTAFDIGSLFFLTSMLDQVGSDFGKFGAALTGIASQFAIFSTVLNQASGVTKKFNKAFAPTTSSKELDKEWKRVKKSEADVMKARPIEANRLRTSAISTEAMRIKNPNLRTVDEKRIISNDLRKSNKERKMLLGAVGQRILGIDIATGKKVRKTSVKDLSAGEREIYKRQKRAVLSDPTNSGLSRQELSDKIRAETAKSMATEIQSEYSMTNRQKRSRRAALEPSIKRISQDKYFDETAEQNVPFTDKQKKEQIKAAKASRIKRAMLYKKASAFTNVAAPIAGAVAVSGGSYLQETAMKDIEAGGKSTTKAAIGGAISGAGQGAAMGAVFGPLGVAVGGVVGGLIGFTKSLWDAQKAIRAVDLGKSIGRMSRVFEDVNSGRLSANRGVGTVRREMTSQKASLSVAGGTERREIFGALKQGAPQLEAFLSKLAESYTSLDKFSSENKDLIMHFATLSDSTLTDFNQRMKEQIELQAKNKTALDRSIKVQDEFSKSMEIVTNTIKAFAQLEIEMNRLYSTLDQVVAGGLGAVTDTGGKDILSKVDKMPTANVQSELTRRYGSSDLVKNTVDASKAMSRIPNALLRAREAAPMGGPGVNRIDTFLNALGADIGPGIRNSLEQIIDSIGNETSDFMDQYEKDPTSVINKLKEFAEPMISALQEQDRIQTDYNNKLSSYYSERLKLLDDERAIGQKTVDIRQQWVETISNMSGREVTGAQLEKFDKERKTQILGTTEERSLQDVGREMIDQQKFAIEQTRKMSEGLNPAEWATHSKALNDNQEALIKNKRYLEFMSDAAARAAPALKQFESIQRQKDIKYNVARQLTVASSLEEEKDIADNLTNMRNLALTGNIRVVRPEQRESTISALEAMGDIPEGLRFLNGLNPRDVVRSTIADTLVRKGISREDAEEVAKIRTTPEEEVIANKINNVFADAVRANSILQVLVQSQTSALMLGIESLQIEFFKRLEGIFAQQQQVKIQSDVQSEELKQSKLRTKQQQMTGLITMTGAGGATDEEKLSNAKFIAGRMSEISSLTKDVNIGSLVEKHLGSRTNLQESGIYNFMKDWDKSGVIDETEFNNGIQDFIFSLIPNRQLAEEYGVGIKSKLQSGVSRVSIIDQMFTDLEKYKTKGAESRQRLGEISEQAGIGGDIFPLMNLATQEKQIADLLKNIGDTTFKSFADQMQASTDTVTSLGVQLEVLNMRLNGPAGSMTELNNRSVALGLKFQELSSSIDNIIRNSQVENPNVPPAQHAGGGVIRGNRRSKNAVGTDTVDAVLTPGEYILRKQAVDKIGVGTLDQMNKEGKIRFAGGGVVFRDPSFRENVKYTNQAVDLALKKFSSQTGIVPSELADFAFGDYGDQNKIGSRYVPYSFISMSADPSNTYKSTFTASHELGHIMASRAIDPTSKEDRLHFAPDDPLYKRIAQSGYNALSDAQKRSWMNSYRGREGFQDLMLGEGFASAIEAYIANSIGEASGQTFINMNPEMKKDIEEYIRTHRFLKKDDYSKYEDYASPDLITALDRDKISETGKNIGSVIKNRFGFDINNNRVVRDDESIVSNRPRRGGIGERRNNIPRVVRGDSTPLISGPARSPFDTPPPRLPVAPPTPTTVPNADASPSDLPVTPPIRPVEPPVAPIRPVAPPTVIPARPVEFPTPSIPDDLSHLSLAELKEKRKEVELYRQRSAKLETNKNLMEAAEDRENRANAQRSRLDEGKKKGWKPLATAVIGRYTVADEGWMFDKDQQDKLKVDIENRRQEARKRQEAQDIKRNQEIISGSFSPLSMSNGRTKAQQKKLDNIIAKYEFFNPANADGTLEGVFKDKREKKEAQRQFNRKLIEDRTKKAFDSSMKFYDRVRDNQIQREDEKRNRLEENANLRRQLRAGISLSPDVSPMRATETPVIPMESTPARPALTRPAMFSPTRSTNTAPVSIPSPITLPDNVRVPLPARRSTPVSATPIAASDLIPSEIPAILKKLWQKIYGPFTRRHTGGMIPGGFNTNVPLMAQGGEFVVNRQAVRNTGVNRLLALNGEGGKVSNESDNLAAAIKSFRDSLPDFSIFTTAISNFNTGVERFNQAMNTTFTGNMKHDVIVNFTGGTALGQEISGILSQQISSLIIPKVENAINEAMKRMGLLPGERK